MKEKAPTRILTDDFACQVLSDMIREEENISTGLFYGINCTSPHVVPIPYTGSKRDYQTWIAFDATSNVMQKSVTVKKDEHELRCILLYVDQTQLPNWYSNTLNEQSTLLGNVLLVVPEQEWPKQLVVSPETLVLLMKSDEEMAEG
jgi:hypothetical protein